MPMAKQNSQFLSLSPFVFLLLGSIDRVSLDWPSLSLPPSEEILLLVLGIPLASSTEMERARLVEYV